MEVYDWEKNYIIPETEKSEKTKIVYDMDWSAHIVENQKSIIKIIKNKLITTFSEAMSKTFKLD